MSVPDDARKCVAFVGAKRADGTYQMMGSAFFLGREREGMTTVDPCYVVTARHVVDKARSLGVQTLGLRMNTKDGRAEWQDTPVGDWVYLKSDPTIDVAIREMHVPSWLDHLALPTAMGVTPSVIADDEVGPGDEVFITGLFRHHHGANRNIPIIRMGALACMGEEKVSTKFGDMDALLIEARSIGGLSGSPVFLQLGPARVARGQIQLSQKIFLLGLVHGHYDAAEQGVDVAQDLGAEDSNNLTNAQINTGIAIVVPFHVIESVLTRYEQRKAQGLTFSGGLGFSEFDWNAQP